MSEALLAWASEALCWSNLVLKGPSVRPMYCLQPSSDDTEASYITHSSRQWALRRLSAVALLRGDCICVEGAGVKDFPVVT